MNSFGSQKNITLALIVINVTVFLLTNVSPALYEYLAIYPSGLFGKGFIWTPVTYMFTHGGFSHILFNMIFLLVVGPAVEQTMGYRDFLAYYLISGALAGMFSVIAYVASGIIVPIVGASGAIYALMLAYATYFPSARLLIWGIIPIKAPHLLLIYLGINLYSHFTGRSAGVANLTHLSGLAFGFLYFLVRLRINPIQAIRDGS